jgi:hypothetical protein
MANGCTSLFAVTKEDFGRLLGDLPETAEIARGRGKSVTTFEVKRRLFEHEKDAVSIDEQDHSWYIVMFIKPGTGRPPKKRGFFQRIMRRAGRPVKVRFNSVSVSETSPLHSRLRKYHKEWLEHQRPGYVAFLSGQFREFDGKEWRVKRE